MKRIASSGARKDMKDASPYGAPGSLKINGSICNAGVTDQDGAKNQNERGTGDNRRPKILVIEGKQNMRTLAAGRKGTNGSKIGGERGETLGTVLGEAWKRRTHILF